ncbi:unnamed protein product [Paramecium sonneborni]|uniref:Uncharacterized protein n=1 Tax=Paramecium sonneborni TaxID=65129 RepID=A0A8S1RBW1_9CILI|nr:unnamed protein product [Paramecium sonneborni]
MLFLNLFHRFCFQMIPNFSDLNFSSWFMKCFFKSIFDCLIIVSISLDKNSFSNSHKLLNQRSPPIHYLHDLYIDFIFQNIKFVIKLCKLSIVKIKIFHLSTLSFLKWNNLQIYRFLSKYNKLDFKINRKIVF